MATLDKVKICVVGLGYVGLPLAVLFARRYPTVGFDIDATRVRSLLDGVDGTGEVDGERLGEVVKNNMLSFTTSEANIKDCNVYIVTVPTPVDDNNHPNLVPLITASQTVGRVISSGNVVIYESTVYPGVTEEECLPEIEQVSGLVLNHDFYAGYSPERINPGDKLHRVENIKKVTSGSNTEAAEFVDSLYNSVLTAGTHRAPSIRVAEASKIVENTQRDVNIAFVNELAKIFNAMGIDTHDVLDAAATKWNFIPMRPGLVGGHCISVDPYYLIQKSQLYGVLPRVMTNARRLNNSMGQYVAERLVKLMVKQGIMVMNARVLIMGFAFKENCPDIRNTKVLDIYHTLQEYTNNICIFDPVVDGQKARREYGVNVVDTLPDGTFDAAIYAVAHNAFASVPLRVLVPRPGVIYDVKGVLPKDIIDARL
ncbi:MAG: nucleotide sugar dehydrogenase [Bacteroidales bacterium]|nr:nucleotide sugar dehydrogenase [Bacteroidales bacterium]